MPAPSAAAKDTITETISSSGATTRAQQHDEDREHDEQRQRDDQPVVARRGLAQVVLLRRRAADQHVAPPARSAASRSSRDLIERRGRVRVALERDRELHAGRALAGRAHVADERAAPASAARHGLAPSTRSPTITSAGAVAPAGKLRESTSWPCDGVDLAAELVAGRLARVEVETLAARTSSTTEPVIQIGRGRARDAVADPAPEAVRLVGAGLAGVRDRVQAGRPERAPPADREQRGQHGQHRDHRQRDAHRADRAEPRGRVDLGDRERQQRGDHRQAGGEDRRARRCAARSPSPRACPRGGAAPRGSARRAAARSPCRRRTRARAGCRRSGR